jgi:hypothetical protein
MDADRNLAASAESGESGSFCGDGEARVGVVEERKSGNGPALVCASLDTKSALPCCWAELQGVKTFANPIGLFKSVKPGGGEKDGVDLAFSQLAQACIDISTKLYGIQIWADGFQLRAAALAAGANFCTWRQTREAGVVL